MIIFRFWEYYRGGIPVIWRRVAGSAFILYFLAANLGGQYLYSKANASSYTLPRELQESYEWLNRNTPAKSVVGAFDFALTNDIQLHTHNKTFLPFMSTAASDEEIWERTMYLARVFGVKPDEFEKFLRESGAVYFLFMERYGNHSFDAAFHGYSRKFPEELILKKAEEYTYTLGTALPTSPYRLDYLYFDRRTAAVTDSSNLTSGFEKVYDKDPIIIYKINESR